MLALFSALAIISGYAVLISLPSEPGPAPQADDAPAQVCTDGSTQYCRSASCSGVSTCVGGIWSGCRWDTVCSPGERVACLKGACTSGVKECNPCGTGFSDCFNP